MQRRAMLFAVVALLAGCRIGTSSPDEFDREYPVARLTSLSPAGMAESLAALREAVGGRVRVTTLSFSDQRTTIIAQNPKVPTSFDSYSFWQGRVYPSAIQTSEDSQQRMVSDLFELDSVPFDRLGALALQAVTALPLDGGHVTSLDVNRTGDGALEIIVSLTSERRTGRVIYDGKGTLLSAKAN
jgi:hypothetical protein